MITLGKLSLNVGISNGGLDTDEHILMEVRFYWLFLFTITLVTRRSAMAYLKLYVTR